MFDSLVAYKIIECFNIDEAVVLIRINTTFLNAFTTMYPDNAILSDCGISHYRGIINAEGVKKRYIAINIKDSYIRYKVKRGNSMSYGRIFRLNANGIYIKMNNCSVMTLMSITNGYLHEYITEYVYDSVIYGPDGQMKWIDNHKSSLEFDYFITDLDISIDELKSENSKNYHNKLCKVKRKDGHKMTISYCISVIERSNMMIFHGIISMNKTRLNYLDTYFNTDQSGLSRIYIISADVNNRNKARYEYDNDKRKDYIVECTKK